jgi:GDP-L-fucose synthase
MNNSEKINLVILGATGFIGRNLALRFTENPKYNVTLVHFNTPKFEINNATWINANLLHISDVKKVIEKAEIVLQAAATTSGSATIVNNPEEHVTDNAVINSLVLREVFHQKIKHFIFFSCTTMYKSDSKLKQSESDFQNISDIFPSYYGVAITKLYIEQLCQFYSNISHTKFTIIRHSNVYGPWDKYDLRRSHVLGATITKVMQAKDKIIVWGDGNEIRDFLYIDDLVDLVEISLKSQRENLLLINAGSDQGISVLNLVKQVARIADKKLKIEFDTSKPNLKFSYIGNSSKAYKSLKWRATTPLDIGISKSIIWWKDNFNETSPG